VELMTPTAATPYCCALSMPMSMALNPAAAPNAWSVCVRRVCRALSCVSCVVCRVSCVVCRVSCVVSG
jgi:hypothetical protein